MTRGGRRSLETEAERRCIVSRATAPRAGLVRFVVGPEDDVVPDLAERLPGRGMWVTAERAILERAIARNLFSRAAKRPVRAAPDLVLAVEAGLARRLVELISMSRRAGEAVAGREKTRDALVAGKAALLLQAADGSPRERSELRAPAGPESLVSCLSAGELGMAFGRDRVVHAAVLRGGLADRVMGGALRLAGFRDDAARSDAGRAVAGDGPRGERLV